MPPEPFRYFLSEKRSILVVALNGSLAKSDASAFRECSKEVSERPMRSVVLSFRTGGVIDPALIPELAMLCKRVRDKPAELRLCGLGREARKALADSGILLNQELFSSLVEALRSLP